MNRLETTLADLAQTVDWPEPSPHLAGRVVARIEIKLRPIRSRVWATAGAIALLVLVIGLIPGTRQAVANLFQEAGVRIGFIEETPQDLIEDLDLGEPTTIPSAATQIDFELSSPAVLGSPDGVYIDDAVISMVWDDGPVLLTQRAGGEIFAQKGLGPETTAIGVSVSGEAGLWIEGAGHTFTLLDEEGNPVEETARLAANVLLWNRDGVDYRLELTGDLDEALEIAGSIGKE